MFQFKCDEVQNSDQSETVAELMWVTESKKGGQN